MGHVYIKVKFRGNKGEKVLDNLLVDTGATYTVLPNDIIREIGSWGELPKPRKLALGDGREVRARIHLLEVIVGNREGEARVAAFPSAVPVLGVDALEALGLGIDPTGRRLIPTRGDSLLYV